ncbi:MAG: helix-turn-helix domain-containing protein [Pseudomonadales bacterium]|nr:helix-turn-helix domain-containing protein [Pseudomonadales bacterium]
MADIPTREELSLMLMKERQELLGEIRTLISESPTEGKRWLKNKDMMKLLSLSYTGLQNLRIKGFPYSKIGGTIFYDYNDVLVMMKKNRVEWPL